MIRGEVACRPNARNPRDLDVEITVEHEGRAGKTRVTHEYKMR